VEMKEGDVFFWRWKAGARVGVSSPYHCWSAKAVVGSDGRLRDTFWSDHSDKLVPLEQVDLTYRGNIHEMKKINGYETQFYREDDVVDMRHSNNSRASVYVVPGAERNPGVMRALVLERIKQARLDVERHKRLIETLTDELAAIDAGRLQDVVPR
jgi:hypothetical protein